MRAVIRQATPQDQETVRKGEIKSHRFIALDKRKYLMIFFSYFSSKPYVV